MRIRVSRQQGAGQVIALVVIALLLVAAYAVMDFYSGGEVRVTMTESRGTQILQGLSKYKLEAGSYPDSLAKLAPKHLATVPACPDGSSFAYQLNGGEFALSCPNVVYKLQPYGYDSRAKSWRG